MMFPSFLVVLVLLGTATALVPHFTRPASIATTTSTRPSTSSHLFSSSVDAVVGRPTELPDSLEDGAEIAAAACASFAEISGNVARCRVDFDTSAGDDTYTLLKSSTPFMQKNGNSHLLFNDSWCTGKKATRNYENGTSQGGAARVG